MKKALILMVIFVIFLSACTNNEGTNCDSLQGTEKADCLASGALSFNSCKNLGDEEKKVCIEKVITAKINPEPCADLDVTKDVDYCVYKFAEKTKDMSFCEKISDLNGKDYCYLGLSSVYGEKACNLITQSGIKNSCEESYKNEGAGLN